MNINHEQLYSDFFINEGIGVKRKMRIGFFSPTINRIGGGEWVTLNMINSLKADGHEILIYSGKKVDSERICSVFGHELKFDEEIQFWPYFFDPFDPKSVYETTIKSFMCKLKCDFLIDTFSNNLLPWSDAVYFQGSAFISYIPKGLRRSYFIPFLTLLRNSSKRADYKDKIAMACSKFSAEQIEEVVGHSVKVLYPPVSDYFRVSDVNKNSKSDIVITVSRFAEEKRLEMVPKIAKLSPDSYSFIIAGACRSSSALFSAPGKYSETWR